jgi:cytochrome c biogenesis protein CcmG, thiol:disulfide interchange protein DsbE
MASVPNSSVPTSAQRGFRLRLILLLVVAVVLGLLALVALRLARGDQSLGEVKLHPYAAPDFSLTLFDGSRFSLAQERGNVVVVNFWASWCVPCRDEAPGLESVWQRYRDRGVVLIGVDIKDTPSDARSFLQHYVSTYPSGFDGTKAIYIDYGVYGLPETFVVDPQGMVVHHIIGPVTESQLHTWLDPLLASARRP